MNVRRFESFYKKNRSGVWGAQIDRNSPGLPKAQVQAKGAQVDSKVLQKQTGTLPGSAKPVQVIPLKGITAHKNNQTTSATLPSDQTLQISSAVPN